MSSKSRSACRSKRGGGESGTTVVEPQPRLFVRLQVDRGERRWIELAEHSSVRATTVVQVLVPTCSYALLATTQYVSSLFVSARLVSSRTGLAPVDRVHVITIRRILLFVCVANYSVDPAINDSIV